MNVMGMQWEEKVKPWLGLRKELLERNGTGGAFLVDFLEQPHRIDLRLIYADWLEEQGTEGDDLLAQWVRVQCALEQHKLMSYKEAAWRGLPVESMPRASPENDRLKDRLETLERSLYGRNEDALLRGPHGFRGDTPFGYRCYLQQHGLERGFSDPSLTNLVFVWSCGFPGKVYCDFYRWYRLSWGPWMVCRVPLWKYHANGVRRQKRVEEGHRGEKHYWTRYESDYQSGTPMVGRVHGSGGVPEPVFNLLRDGSARSIYEMVPRNYEMRLNAETPREMIEVRRLQLGYETTEQAVEELESACLRWARLEAGLPDITEL